MRSYMYIRPEDYGVSPQRGFLPAKDPLTRLPSDFAFYDEFGRQIPDFLGAGIIRARASELPLPPRPTAELAFEEKMLLALRLSFTISAYVNQYAHLEFIPKKARERAMRLKPKEETIVVPKNLVLPFIDVTEQLGVPPILSYAFYSPYNWEKIDPMAGLMISNLKTIQSFLGGMDERHFILDHIEIESCLGQVTYDIPLVQHYARPDIDYAEGVERALTLTADLIEFAVESLEKMIEACHPDIYYIRVRPYIFGFNLPGSGRNVVFDGLAKDKRVPVLRGETGAQTSSFPAIWALVGINFSNDKLKHHVLHMRNYMLPAHRAFIEAVEKGPSIREYILGYVREKRKGAKGLKNAYNRAIKALYRYFRLHRSYARIYIARNAKKYVLHKEQGEYGTGDTPYMEYLTKHCEEIYAHIIK